MKTTAAYLSGVNQPFEVTDLDLDPPHATEVLVRLHASGICASDAHTRSGRIPSPMPCVLGHEGAGVVEAVGDQVTHVAPGDHVALSWMPNCGRCHFCEEGRPVLCTAARPYLLAGTLLDGTSRLHKGDQEVFHYSFLSTFATHTVVPAASAIRIDPEVPFEVAALVGCAVMTGVGAVINRAAVRPGRSILIYGLGGVGLSALMAAKLSGAAPIIVVDPDPAKRDLASSFGATLALNANAGVVDSVHDYLGGRGVDYAIDAVAAPGVSTQAFNALSPGGTLVCVGVPASDSMPSFPGPNLVRDEKIITGSLYGSARPSSDMPRILDLYKRGELPLERLVSKRYELGQVNEAFEDLRAGKLIRGVLTM